MHSFNDIEKRRGWAHQLLKEHEFIAWNYNVKLSRPIIEIIDSKTIWGSWNSHIRTIKISAELIVQHSWDTVINILKHEMAHQAVVEIFEQNEAHGRYFQKACDLLGVPSEFRGSGGDIPRDITESIDQKLFNENRNIYLKVKKLLSLAQSKNEHESLLAMKKANELMHKYNIERIELSRKSEYIYKIINLKRKRLENYHRKISMILTDHFFVDIVYAYLYDAKTLETHRTMELVGTAENVLIADYVYHFLMYKINYLWEKHKMESGVRGYKKKSYWLGVLEGFRKKMSEMDRETNISFTNGLTTSALVIYKDAELQEFMNGRFPRLRKYRAAASKVDLTVYNDGIREGKKINLNKGIEFKDGYHGKMIEG